MPPTAPGPYGVRGGARTTQRRGRMSDAKRSVLVGPGARWLLGAEAIAAPGGLGTGFGRAAPLMVDIGGGTGEATRAWALDHPDHDVLAVELHRPGLARLVSALEAGGPSNVRVVEADATTLLAAWPARSVAQVRVLFPDPWPKRRHVGRRLVEPGFVRRAADLLHPGGRLHVATDWPDYAEQMRASLATEARLHLQVDGSDGPTEERANDRSRRLNDGSGPVERPVAADDPGQAERSRPAEAKASSATSGSPDEGTTPPGGGHAARWWSHRPDRPITAYEQRGLDAGRPITDLVARRIG